MGIVLDPNEPAINRGIKTVGIGKKGSRALTSELALEIVDELKSGKVSAAAKGAFFAGLCAKGIEPQEEILEQAFVPGILRQPSQLLKTIASDAPEFVKWVCVQLLQGHTLDRQTAYDLGKFLFSDEPGDAARGWVASFLRVRYETNDEYEGLLQAMDDTLEPPFKIPAPQGGPIIQIAEPFDGVDHSYMITPLIGQALQKEGYRVAHQVGRSSGPKSDMNLWDIAQALGVKPALSNADLAVEKPGFGWFFYQALMSRALDRWVDLRRQIIKRPFLATLERFINPLKADILIASAFHPPYGEKMMTIAERAGFKSIIIVRNGIEGTIAFPLLRDVKLLLSARQKDGSFQRHELIIENSSLVDTEEMIKKPKASDNANLIETYIKEGTSGNKHFDLRVKITCEGLHKALAFFPYGFRFRGNDSALMKKISFYTFGCRLNQSETASIRNSFEQGGYQVVGFDEPSDIVVINTCTVTEGGDADTRHLVHKVNRLNPAARIALVGCQAQIQKEQLANLPNVRWIVGNGRKMDLVSVFNEYPKPDRPRVVTPSIERGAFYLPAASLDPGHTRANIKIQDGCDFFCSFCEIPYARGRARSRVFEDIFTEAAALVAGGHKELILTGINIGTYSYQKQLPLTPSLTKEGKV